MESTPESSTKPSAPGKAVERLFPFLARARKLLIGREVLARSKRDLYCLIISTDLSDNSKEQVMRQFRDYPIIQKYTAAELERFFGVRNAKVIGLAKSPLARSIYAELKSFRVNTSPTAAAPAGTGAQQKVVPPRNPKRRFYPSVSRQGESGARKPQFRPGGVRRSPPR